MNFGRVYCVTNKVTGEQYVGQTTRSVKKRWDAHWRTAVCPKARKAKFQNALVAYGKDAFVVETVYEAFDANALNAAEIAIIAHFTPAYNSSRGGKGLRPVFFSEERRSALAYAAKVRWNNPEWRTKTTASLRAANTTPAAVARGHLLAAYKGAEKRWAGHTKKPLAVCDRSAVIRRSWENPETRAKRIAGLRAAASTPDAKARFSKYATGKKMPVEAIERSARAKWKPLYCAELGLSFLSGKHAAEYLGVLHTSVANAVKNKGKVLRKYTLVKVM